MKKILLILVCVLLVLAGATAYLINTKTERTTLPTYFMYKESDRTRIHEHTSDLTFTAEDIFYWDQQIFDLVRNNTQDDSYSENLPKVYAYLTLAQRDFAFLSHNTSGAFNGSIDGISKEVLCIFFNDDCNTIVVRHEDDEYSRAIAQMVLTKIKDRIAEDEAGLEPYVLLQGESYWNSTESQVGIDIGNSIGFFIESGDVFRVPAPVPYDSPEFRRELQDTQSLLLHATEAQKEIVVTWAGGPGTRSVPGQLLFIADTYMEEKETPLPNVLFIRSVLSMSVADAEIGAFDSKYTYLVKRPNMMDDSLLTIMPTPNHPSYPSAHSVLSSAAAEVLSHYLPENEPAWNAMAEEAGNSRLWGGIHYPMDDTTGKALGVRIGEEAIAKSGEIE